MSSPARQTGEQHLTPTVKTSGLRRRLKAREELGRACWSKCGVVEGWRGAVASEDSVRGDPRSSSTFLDSGFLAAFLKPHRCWKLWREWTSAAEETWTWTLDKLRQWRSEHEPLQDLHRVCSVYQINKLEKINKLLDFWMESGVSANTFLYLEKNRNWFESEYTRLLQQLVH